MFIFIHHSIAETRQVKCDRSSPCSSCVTAKIPCHFASKRPERKQRLHPSARYDEKLNYICQQLEGLSSTLEVLVEANGQPNSQTLATLDSGGQSIGDSSLSESTKNTTGVNRISQQGYTSDGPSPAEGIAQDVVRTLLHDAKAEDSLTSEHASSQSCAFSQYPQLADLSLPPMDHVLRLLTFMRLSPQRYFADKPEMDEDEFAEVCQKVYFPTKQFSVFAWVSMNCVLFHLFRDLDDAGIMRLQLTRLQASRNSKLCFNNVGRATQVLNICVPSSSEAVCALVSAAAVNMENADGFLAWKLVCTAARMALDLGYHRLSTDSTNKQVTKARKLFWYVYGMDKSLAFNFGRTSTIQDYDVSTAPPTYADDFGGKWGVTLLDHLDYVKLQYDIYEQLMSPRARREEPVIRTSRVHDFVKRLLRIKGNYAAALEQGSYSQPGLAHSLELAFSSVLTLIYRELAPDPSGVVRSVDSDQHSPPLFHTSCIKAGRAALIALVQGWTAVQQGSDENVMKIFVNMSFLFMPFMPFVAVFSNQIVSASQEDLILLREVVKIIGTAKDVSAAFGKTYNAYSKLLMLAEACANGGEAGRQRFAQPHQMQLDGLHDQVSQAEVTDDRQSPRRSTVDNSMINMDIPPSSMMSWETSDFDVSHQDWNTMFNEFDLGLGAESTRNLMPWLEQHMDSVNARD